MYFAPYLDGTGLHLPSYTDRMEDLCASYAAIFGAEAVLTPAAPDYQLLSAFAKALDDVSALALAVYNSRNPAYARGQSLDLLLPLYGLTRRGATYSTVGLALSGAAGTVVPAGSAAADAEGRIWRTAEAVTLEGGAASVSAVCDLPGPVWAAPGTVTSILTAVAGWTAVTNPEGSVLGLAEETDAQARARMASALAGRGNTIADALTAAIAAIPYVRSQALHINETDTTDARGVPPHTLAAVVYLGNQEAIARAIYEKKAPGIGTWGSVTVNVEDGEGNLHPISFSRPETVLLNLTLSLARLEGFDRSAVTEALEEALRQEINGKPIGEALNVPRLIGLCYSAAGDLASTFVLTDLQASTAEATTSGLLPVAWNERLSLPSGGVTFQVT